MENDELRVMVTVEGGHIAEILHKPSGVNPLWTPPWPSIEPSTYDRAKHPEYGNDSESKLLSGIMGHNLCLDIFGGPSDEEYAAGLQPHGEASVATYALETGPADVRTAATLSESNLRVERRLELNGDSITRHVVARLGQSHAPLRDEVFEQTVERADDFGIAA